jgi:hypothetical protein
MLPRMLNGVIRMRCFWFCVAALLAVPALARSDYYSGDAREPRLRSDNYSGNGREPRLRSHGKGHRGGRLSRQIVEPLQQGPAPTGFWYRCDLPSGYYPYIPTCQTPWRIVPSTPYR